eukprot:TRINITY_DN6106_c0_g1_i1.p1 TRINITY_DN6106_c0_g1~~TRINITY_DN6106_c0_g1_i1.p1  ORF type:complete len:103 (-),score=22.16 TRINITY_DN6106_c0_g1_i1:85-393(-)
MNVNREKSEGNEKDFLSKLEVSATEIEEVTAKWTESEKELSQTKEEIQNLKERLDSNGEFETKNQELSERVEELSQQNVNKLRRIERKRSYSTRNRRMKLRG